MKVVLMSWLMLWATEAHLLWVEILQGIMKNSGFPSVDSGPAASASAGSLLER